jgi:glycosyltransferase involved in cell wall biosynthesis
MARYQRLAIRRAAAGAAVVVTVSEASGRRIVERLGVDPARVLVTREAARPLFRRIEDADAVDRVRRAYGLARPFILAFASSDPRKNVGGLVDAFATARVAAGGCTLAVVASCPRLAGEFEGRVSRLGLSSSVRFLTGVSDEELAALYNGATVFVLPSFEEGFGLPLLEAMACGTPVIAFDNSSIPEITGGAALLVPTGSTDELARRMAEAITDAALRRRLADLGLARAREFSWERCARETLAAYERAARGRPSSS